MGRVLGRGGRGPPALALALAPALALALAAPASAATPSDMYNGIPAVLSRLRQEGEEGAALFSVEEQANSWVCKTHGYHDGTDRENNFVAPRCVKDGQDLDAGSIAGYRFDSGIYTLEELKEAGQNTNANKEACEGAGGEYVTDASICASTYLDEEDFSFEKFVRAVVGDNEEAMYSFNHVFAPVCCGSKPLDKWPVCEVWSGAEADGKDRSREIVSLECLIGPDGNTTDITESLTDFQSNPRVASREALLDPSNFAMCQSHADGARVSVTTCGQAQASFAATSAANSAAFLPFAASYAGDLCCPGEKQSEDKATAALEKMFGALSGPKHEAQSWLCQNYGYHDGKDRSSPDAQSPVTSVKCMDSRLEDPEPVDCDRVTGMACNNGVFGKDRLMDAANKQACAQHFDGAGVLKLETCAQGEDGVGVYHWPEEYFVGRSEEEKAMVLGIYGPQCCGSKPYDNDISKLCDKSSAAGPPDGEDRSRTVLNVDCVRKDANGTKDEGFTENVPGFKYLRIGVPGDNYPMEELLSQENMDACVAGGGTGLEVGSCSTFAYYASLFGLDSDMGKYFANLIAPKCCTLSEEEENRPKSGPEMEKNSWVCQKYGSHDGSDHTGRAMGVSCQNSDGEDYDSGKIKGFRTNTLVYTLEELDTAANKAACEAHAEGARFEVSTCDSIFMYPFLEQQLAAQGEEAVNAAISGLGPVCCGQKPISESHMCKGGEGEPPFGAAQRLVSVNCERFTADGEEEKLEDVPGFLSVDALLGAVSEHSRDELLSEENQATCLAAGGDKLAVTNCATMAMYSAMFAGTEAEKSFAPYYPVLRHICCGGPYVATGFPGAPGGSEPESDSDSWQPTSTGCHVLGSLVHTANHLRMLGAPELQRRQSPVAEEVGKCAAI